MLDQNLLDKQYILDALIDLLEKNSIITQRVSTSSHQYTPVNEFPTARLVLNTSTSNLIN